MKTPLTLSTEDANPLEYCIIAYKPNAPAAKDNNLHEKKALEADP
jgi:hypothetical protein